MKFNLQRVLVKPAGETDTLLASVRNTNVPIDKTMRYIWIGSVSVTFRSCIVRLALFNLLGIGVVVAISGINAATPSLRRSCALAAAVNFVACCYYLLIYRVRNQEFVAPLSPVRIEVGLTDKEYLNEIAKNANTILAQEVIVDSYRHSDWLVTLVLMVLDIAWIAEDINPGGRGLFDGVHYTALAQVLIVTLGTVPRFLLNDLRRNENGEWQRLENMLLGSFCYLLALVIWFVASLDLHLRVGDPDDGFNTNYKWALLFVIWGQVGYPLAAFLQFIWINFLATDLNKWANQPHESYMPSNQYSPLLSLSKDVVYGALDVLSKGGLALLCVVRAAEYELAPLAS